MKFAWLTTGSILGIAAMLASAVAGCAATYSLIQVPAPQVVGVGAPKLPLSGLLDMQDISWHNTQGMEPAFVMANVQQFPGVFGGIVVNATWNQMQPSSGGAIDFSAVDAALAQVRTYNGDPANGGHALGVKLRIYQGSNAPDWAKQLAGGPITIYRNPAGCGNAVDTCPLVVGLYWSQPYIGAWRAFQTSIATKYDQEPLIRAVAVTSCAGQTDEPFVPSVGPVSKAALKSAAVPYTDAAEQACLTGAVDDYAAWQHTAIDFTFNPFDNINGGANTAFSLSVMALCRSKLGGLCVLDNHALSAPLNSADQPIYTAIAAAGKPINFQTQAPEVMTCLWQATIAQGVGLGAGAIEVWPAVKLHGFTSLALADVKTLAAEFTAPIPVTTPAPLPTPCSGFH